MMKMKTILKGTRVSTLMIKLGIARAIKSQNAKGEQKEGLLNKKRNREQKSWKSNKKRKKPKRRNKKN